MKRVISFVSLPVFAAAIFAVVSKVFVIFPMMPVQASLEAEVIDRAFQGCLTLTIAIFSLVMAAMGFILWQFRAQSPADQGPRVEHSQRWWLESLWIGGSLVLTIGLAAFGWIELKHVYGSPEADLDIQVRAEQFSWEFFYPKFNLTASRLYLPLGKRVRIALTSKDVLHSFWVPEFRMKQDAVPGKITTLLMTPTRAGTYFLLCNQLCGRDHTDMTALVEVVDENAFNLKFTNQEEAW